MEEWGEQVQAEVAQVQEWAAELVQVAGARWMVECSFQQAKGQTGLDHYQVRRYDAWYRHASLAMAAQAFLAAVRAQAAAAGRVGMGGG